MRTGIKVFILFFLLLAVIAVGIACGPVRISPAELLSAQNRVILNMRLLRVLTAVLAGSGLAVSGIALQAILRNPLAEPYLLGTSSGAGLAAVIALVCGISRLYLPLYAFCGAVASIILVYLLACGAGRVQEKSLILSGVIVSVAFSAVIVFLVSLSGEKVMHEMTWWLWGSLQVYDPKLLAVVSFPVIAGICAIYFFSQDLNALSIGEEESMHLGIDADKIKKLLILVSALITAGLVCVCGIIGFVGLIVPHMMRLLAGPDHKRLIPLTCISAAIFMVVCDIVSRTLFSPLEVPAGVITAIIGAPVFIVLLKRSRRAL
ncbi:MAG: iron ABC transporter permease [Candidatus Omnitrophota bacterium]|jgi:iron complex transport system permease protein